MATARPKTEYARSGDVNIAYQVVGEGELDLVYVPGWISNVEQLWSDPFTSRFIERLGTFARVILFDKRGTGLSDHVDVTALPTLEQRMDDVRAVVDAVGSEQTALLGMSEGGPMCALFAATYPQRTTALIMYGSYARGTPTEDYPWGLIDPAATDEFFETLPAIWDDAGGLIRVWAPSMGENQEAADAFGSTLRMGASPAAAIALLRMNMEVDVRDALPVIQTPTLVLHRSEDLIIDVGAGRHLGDAIPDARYVEFPGQDHLWYHGDWEAITGEIEEFLTGVRTTPEPDRVLATVMFTDIVDSTARASELGDSSWRALIERHDELIGAEIKRNRGRVIKTLGDGVLATFDGPARGIRCATSACEAVQQLGIDIRAGLHTGECELIGDDVGGIAVNIGARVSAKAGAGEVLVSRTVTDLVAGSGLEFDPRGTHELKGVPGEWKLFAVRS